MPPVPPRRESDPTPAHILPPVAKARTEESAPVPVPRHSVRPRSMFVAVLAVALLAYSAWAYFRPPSGDPPSTNDVRSVRVWAGPWSHEQGAAPNADTSDPETVEALLAVVRSAQETHEHKCSLEGVIHLRRSFGRYERLAYLPGHDPQWYEFRHGQKIYRAPREPFVAVMRRLGVEVPLQP